MPLNKKLKMKNIFSFIKEISKIMEKEEEE